MDLRGAQRGIGAARMASMIVKLTPATIPTVAVLTTAIIGMLEEVSPR